MSRGLEANISLHDWKISNVLFARLRYRPIDVCPMHSIIFLLQMIELPDELFEYA
jgi:hypothetical protein